MTPTETAQDPSLSTEEGSFESFFGDAAPPLTEEENLDVTELWQTRAFGLAVSLHDEGYFEWETFRQQLIATIEEWDNAHDAADADWDYWECWLDALQTVLQDSDLLEDEEVEAEIQAILDAC